MLTKKKAILRLVFCVAAITVVLCAFGAAMAEDECTGLVHKGPFSYRNQKLATCTEPGSWDKYCDACGKFIGTEPIGAIGHKYETHKNVITAPTCLSSGSHQETDVCKVCGYSLAPKDVTDPALGHDWGSWNVTTPATCTSAGVETRVCKRDSSHVETQPIAPLGHNWGPWTETTAPTCDTEGVSTRVCKNDPSHTETKAIPAKGHSWDEGKVVKQPDCTNPGQRLYTCKNNSAHTKTEAIPIVPDAHKWDNGKIVKAPNCTYSGERLYTCTINSAHTRTESIPFDPDAHDWDNGVIIKAATCDAPGTIKYTCRINAAHTKTATIPALGHNWDKGTVIKAPTFTEEGEKRYVCQNDSSHVRTEKMSRLVLNNNTVCAFGPRLRDSDIAPVIYPNTTDVWYMFTPFDASKDGVQTYELVASNQYIVGSLTLTIRDGQLTVDYKLADTSNFNITLEFFTVLHSITDISQYEPEQLLALNMIKGRPIDLAETFGEDTNLVLYFCSRCNYSYSNRYTPFAENTKLHQDLRRTMISLMD